MGIKPKRQKKCKVCGKQYSPYSTTQKACSPKCALEVVRVDKEKSFKRETKQRKQALKTRAEWMKEAQKAFNQYIRLRDAKEPCISCGTYGEDQEWKLGGAFDCGHFLSVGSTPELRFDERNAHKQCKSCNSGEGKYGKFNGKSKTVSQAYDAALRIKIGDEAVDELNGPQEPKHYTIDDLKAIKEKYNKKARELKKLEKCNGK